MGEPWEGVVSVPEGKIGTYAVEHFTMPPGEIERSNLRTALMGGQCHPPIVFDRETRWHRLTYDGGTWIADLPIEQQQHDDLLRPFHGTVLVGGLGIGYAANVLAAREEIEEVVVVEISKEVCDLVGPHVKDPDSKVEIVNADLFEFLKANDRCFEWGFYDIWQSDGEGTFHETVVPLRELTGGWIMDHCVVCWNENVMRGQLYTALLSGLSRLELKLAPPGGDPITLDHLATPVEGPGEHYWNWAVPFWKSFRAGKITKETFDKVAGEYAGTYGRMGWESWWLMTYAA